MSVVIYKLLAKLLVVFALVAPRARPLLDGPTLAELQASYRHTSARLDALDAKLSSREAEYRTILGQIDELKHGPDTLRGRMQLEARLDDSRRLAERMQALQRKIRDADDRLRTQRVRLVRAIDAKMGRLEARVGQTASAKRPAIVAQLNELRGRRDQLRAPLPSAPTDDQLDQTLGILDGAKDVPAEDLLAAADELQDTRDQLQRRLDAIGGRLDRLRQAKLLARRARDFGAEGRFFDETNRRRFLGHSGRDSGEATSNNQSNSGGAGQESPGTDTPSMGDDQSRAPGPDGAPSPDGAPEPAAGDDGRGGAGSPDFDAQPPNPTPDTAAPGTPDEAAPDASDGTDGRGVFGIQGDVIDGQDDSPRPSQPGFESDRALKAQIETLEAEQRRLEQQADQLEHKAESYRERAHDGLR